MIWQALISFLARKKISSLLQFERVENHRFDEKKERDPLMLYVHVPFCEELCPYCSFHRVPFNENLCRRYYSALRKEISIYKEMGFKFSGVYFGGGTPTVLIDELSETLNLIRESFLVEEISVETNPNHLTPERMEILRALGVKRLSVGVQSFDDSVLKSVKRFHKYGSGKEILERIKAVSDKFQTLNVDMIFNFPNQTLESLRKDLDCVIESKTSQVTYYPLMVSSRTLIEIEKTLGKMDPGKEKIFYETILETLSKDFFPSTAWCFSKKDGMIDEYVVNYEEYAGLGSGSIGYVDGYAYANTFNIQHYIASVEKGRLPISGRKKYTLKQRLQYDFLMKLFGLKLDLSRIKRKYGAKGLVLLLPEITFFLSIGALRKRGNLLYLTRRGLYYWVIMMREFFTGVNNFRDFLRASS